MPVQDYLKLARYGDEQLCSESNAERSSSSGRRVPRIGSLSLVSYCIGWWRSMADAGVNSEEHKGSVEEQIGSLEEQIQRVEEQIGRVEEQIGRVEEQIGRVEEQIRRVEGQIENCSDQQERSELRDEKAQLRDETAQLRAKEAQLRAKEALLQEGRGLGTEYEWLVQKVVAWATPSGARIYTSCSNRERMWVPVKVEHWDVTDQIEEFLSRANKTKRVYNLAVTANTRITAPVQNNEEYFVSYILMEMRTFMMKKEPQSKFGYKPQVSVVTKDGGGNDGVGLGEGSNASGLVDLYARGPVADFVVTSREKNALVIEVKNGGLGSDGDDLWYLHKIWRNCYCASGEGDLNCWCKNFGITPAHGDKVIRCINQLYENMVLAKVGYGVLTDVRNWYLVKRDNAGCLKISVGFTVGAERPRVLAALSFLVHTASGDNSEFGDPTGNGQLPGASPSEDSRDLINDRNYTAPKSNTSVSEIPRSVKSCSGGEQLALDDVSAEDLNLKKAGGVISCEGWSGCVVIGRLHGQTVALKFAYLGTERAEALLKEVVAYTKMEKLWGIFVPRLIEYGTTNNGRVVFVATELIEGVKLEEVAVTQEVETAALQALDGVHACGLLHGDVSPSNIMVVWGKQPPVRILDFGFSCVTSNKKLQQAERVGLERLLTHMMK